MSLDRPRCRAVAIEAARAAGEILRASIDSIREIRHKGAVDLVTDVDLASEREIVARLRAAFPTHQVLAEEGGSYQGAASSPYRWIVDPLDGTTNYAHGFPFCCVSIGLEVEGELTLGVACAPLLDELFVAEAGLGATLNDRPIQVSATAALSDALLATGFPYDRAAGYARALDSFDRASRASQAVRRAGSAVLDLCYVACGRFDAYWEHQVKPWDVAAGALIVHEAGGTVTLPDGQPFDVDAGAVLASNRLLHPALTQLLVNR